MIATITLRVNRDEGAKELFGYESDRRRNLLICMNCLRKSFVFQLPRHQWNAYSAGATITSELVIIVVKFKNFKIKFVKVHTGHSIQVFIRGRPVDVGIAMPDRSMLSTRRRPIGYSEP